GSPRASGRRRPPLRAADRLLSSRALAADVGVVAGPHARVDHADLAVQHGLHALGDRAPKLYGIRDRADALGALRDRERGEIDVRLVDALADPLVLDGSAAHPRHALLVRLVVVERAIVADHEETRDLVMRRGPQRGEPHQVVAVADQANRNPARALQRQAGAHRDARARADAGAAVAAEIVERMREVARLARPA